MAAPETITYFAETDFRGKKTKFGIKKLDRARHLYVIGKTGMGKSTMLENMAIQDIQNGEGIAFIDPHGTTAEKLLQYVPEHRIKDVIYFAPFDLEHPVSFNVMEDIGKDQRHLVANGLMASFKKVWPDVWSARMEYILNNILLALLEYPDSTLLGVNRMLSDKDFRNKVVANVSDPSVKAFWTDEFAKYTEKLMTEAGASIQNKIGQLTSNPLIRNIVGQPKSTINVREIMDTKKILIMNLSKGRIGEINANLIGGMLITKIYLAAMSRASASPAAMKVLPELYFYVDEFQSFVNDTFKDILSEARKYKLCLTIAHQYIEQMPEEVRFAVFGNVGTTIAFRVGPFDAEILEKIFDPYFMATDMVNLGFAQIYLTLMIDGVGSPPFSAKTLGPILEPAVSFVPQIMEHSRGLYARPREAVEAEIRAWHEPVRKELPARPASAGVPSQQGTNAPRMDRGGQGSGPSTGGYSAGSGSRAPERERRQPSFYKQGNPEPRREAPPSRPAPRPAPISPPRAAPASQAAESVARPLSPAPERPASLDSLRVKPAEEKGRNVLKEALAQAMAEQERVRQEKKSEPARPPFSRTSQTPSSGRHATTQNQASVPQPPRGAAPVNVAPPRAPSITPEELARILDVPPPER